MALDVKQRGSRVAEQDAATAFGTLPPEVRALGRPLSVHPPSAAFKFATSTAANRMAALIAAIVLLVAAAVTVVPYFQNKPLGLAPPNIWLMMSGFCLLFGLWAGGYWIYIRRGGDNDGGAEARRVGFLVYPQALVRAQDGQFTVIRWDEVKELLSPFATATGARKIAGPTRIVARDGRSIDLATWVKDEGTLLATTYDQVSAHLLPRYWAGIEAGKKVAFGDFAISRRGVFYKEKKLAWDEISGLKIVTGSVYYLEIKAGGLGLWPWCRWNPRTAPNDQVALELVRRLAPPHLLKSTWATR